MLARASAASLSTSISTTSSTMASRRKLVQLALLSLGSSAPSIITTGVGFVRPVSTTRVGGLSALLDELGG